MVFGHTARVLRYTRIPDGGATPESVNMNNSSTSDDDHLTERNFVAEDEEIFAPYQPLNGRPYDLGNPFDRTNLALRIRRCIDSRQDYICLIERLYRAKLMPKRDYLGHTAEAAIQLQRHRKALFLLASLGSY